MRMENIKKFDQRLKKLLTVSGMDREELARAAGVSVPVVNRWLNGASAPDVYQFQAIANYFGLPYGWFLDGGDSFPGATEVAERLGLKEYTVRAMLFMAGSEDAAVMNSVDDAVWAVLSAVVTAYKRVCDELAPEEDAG